ncbi:hypothetical protein HMPREF0373_02003 [Eubacterium ramulus ATCC 29099]|uniref:Uncharacterized protein n=1 Tax=Eubacterium ramulus ATCC 29099 TaxID=1256908 RepID=U2QWG7_EUBRA|nr:hypothetical protein HMPREF0373_02003 [Eubacterium ramulus ATCC 29099]
MADGRLGQIKILGSPGKIAIFSYCDKIGQLFLIHKYLRSGYVIIFKNIYKKYLSIMQKYMNFTKENLHVTINVTQKRLGVNENYARKISGVSPPK